MTYTAGPVPLNSQDYVNRAFEAEVLSHLLKREWVLLLGPRQHGKTSALIRIRGAVTEAGFRCAFVDLQALPPALSFPQLLEWFARKIANSMGLQLTDAPRGPADSLEDWLNCAVPMPGAPVVILIDEASSIRDEGVRNAFYGQIRALKSAGAASNPGSLSSVLQFAFSGTFRPESLVDELNSPFNVCRRVETTDLNLKGTMALAKIALGREDVEAVSRAIFAGVGGQPHLVQYMLGIAVAQQIDGQEEAIAAELDRLSSEGNDHLDSIFRTVVQDRSLIQIASVAAAHGRVLNDPANADYKFMMILGLMRREAEFLVFRNALYERVAKASPQLRPEEVQVVGIASHFYPLNVSNFAFMRDVEYREIGCCAYNGAVAAINAGSYRLALVGFGVALEALLIDFLVRRPAGTISAALAAANGDKRPQFDSRYEDSANPETWRLVNLEKVARLLNGLRGPLDVPGSLREMRNLVHPNAMKRAYLPEPELQPEAVTAGGLIGIVMRDIQGP